MCFCKKAKLNHRESLMAGASRTVRVSGMPAHIEEERLIDKLAVHFLRPSNGGGEIESVIIDRTKPYSALVQFEDSGVAQRVFDHGRHTLKVDGKDYELSVSKHWQSPDPNKLITSLTATVDYKHFPEGSRAITRLLRDHPDVEASCDSANKLYRLCGAYTKVQSVLAQLLDRHAEALQSPKRSVAGQPSVRRAESLTERVDQKDLKGGSPIPEEELSLMLDADVFQYLQKRYGQEYQRLQSQHGVKVVDMSSQGITTLFLQVVTPEGGKERKRIEQARMAIRDLSQECERRICQTKLRKCDLDHIGDLQHAMATLRVRFPELLLNEDDSCVFLIGDCCDVSEAKQFLLQERRTAETESIAHRRGISSPRQPAAEKPLGLSSPQCSRALDDQEDLVQPSEKERRPEDGEIYHLAAPCKGSGPPLRSIPVDLSLCGASNTRKEPLEATKDPLGHSIMRSKTSADVTAKSTRPVWSTTPFRPPVKMHTGSTARKTKSFSGATQQGLQKTEDDSSASLPRTRTSSLTDPIQRDQNEVYHAEVLVPTVMWLHIKEVYRTQVEALTCNLELNEVGSQDRIQSAIRIRGSQQSAVTACQHDLQELVDAVSSDFSVRELHLSELNLTNLEDETLQACCAEVRQRFAKITIRMTKRSLYLLGPKRLCYQVGASLREVFCADRAQTKNKKGRQISESLPYSATRISNHTRDQTQTELDNGQIATRRDPVIKEKLERASIGDHDRGKILVHGTKESPTNVNGGRSPTAKSNKSTLSNQKEGLPGVICVCGESATSMKQTKCGVFMCINCLDAVHVNCRVCHNGSPQHRSPVGIRGSMNHCKLNFSLPGHNKHTTIKVTYVIPDGIQEVGSFETVKKTKDWVTHRVFLLTCQDHHPSPGKPFHGDVFEAFFPDCDKSRKLLPRLEDAFRRGLIFTVTSKEKGSKVCWDTIPHKTTLQGGRSGNGYPDSSYLRRLSDILTSHGIVEQASTS
ncbi:uncharacterized protein si:busm1-163l24.3 isoform X2 [Corythoichthys intestinalis]|uniref:uncharacterized protein si:busm1-163l24.3 isoform X2 n=1 Tax=Corythoichthys intestinalis TaxID=161448 RepID=UPI0025A58560|nr:uncharacterized protein si:busm1-163l24.3 isoform X2 [Corythoichthys intestinalis]